MKTIYLLLTRSGTFLSGVIHHLTNAPYTHISLATTYENGHFGAFYSFGRKIVRLPLPAGFVEEKLYTGYFGAHPDTRCTLIALPVSDEAHGRICRKLREMADRAETYRYNLLGVILCYWGISLKRQHHFFCSQFVADVLDSCGAVELPKPSSLMHPMDYTALDAAEFLFTGRIGELLSHSGALPICS